MISKTIDKLRSIFKTSSSIYWWPSYEAMRVCGHVGQPRIGDVITTKMKSGKIGVFEIVKVEWCNDPRNMYFADVKPVGYWEDAK